MIRIEPPENDAKTVFEACISRIEDAGLKGRLTAISASVGDAGTDYRAKAAAATLHLIPRNAPLTGVADKEIQGVYDRMVSGPGRATYDELLARAPNGKCPLCGQQPVGSLDHHLPRKWYPIFAVTPVNLVPACSDCNKAKWQSYPTCERTQTLHPYFDDVSGARWLQATVIPGTPAGFVFQVIQPAGWTEVMIARVRHHVALFKLADLYAFHAVELMSNISSRLAKLAKSGGTQAVRDHLKEEADSCAAASLNSWQAATYQAMAASEWFCSVGHILPVTKASRPEA